MRLVLLMLVAVSFARPQELVIVRDGGKDYHRPACALIRDGKNVLAMSKGEAEGKGLVPHADCDPANPKNDPNRAAAPVYVFVDGGAYYHREKCEKLKRDAQQRVTLDTAGKKQWPCRTCKPPIRARKTNS